MTERPEIILTFIGLAPLPETAYTYRGTQCKTAYFAELLKKVYPKRLVSVFLNAATFADHEANVQTRLGVKAHQSPPGLIPTRSGERST